MVLSADELQPGATRVLFDLQMSGCTAHIYTLPNGSFDGAPGSPCYGISFRILDTYIRPGTQLRDFFSFSGR